MAEPNTKSRSLSLSLSLSRSGSKTETETQTKTGPRTKSDLSPNSKGKAAEKYWRVGETALGPGEGWYGAATQAHVGDGGEGAVGTTTAARAAAAAVMVNAEANVKEQAKVKAMAMAMAQSRQMNGRTGLSVNGVEIEEEAASSEFGPGEAWYSMGKAG
ncbi:uncharacterized protein HMPREF1541_09726 [Cyphellophora europaea CBS 101466]|uniref:Uncharacterized protein n=1 Tax=Cyphellophora europaea (strain CBS 101466) TaxID=1220924 RepID=W2S822_CYPE1|nr:uncharacterized protein HMPREF1541_09726 [Cyphellophora europaea CBS 101466]ETN44851.1 hypothetical protein HMPREF1541_09726 [Cyphellophora europaea CBS 101466]